MSSEMTETLHPCLLALNANRLDDGKATNVSAHLYYATIFDLVIANPPREVRAYIVTITGG